MTQDEIRALITRSRELQVSRSKHTHSWTQSLKDRAAFELLSMVTEALAVVSDRYYALKAKPEDYNTRNGL